MKLEKIVGKMDSVKTVLFRNVDLKKNSVQMTKKQYYCDKIFFQFS